MGGLPSLQRMHVDINIVCVFVFGMEDGLEEEVNHVYVDVGMIIYEFLFFVRQYNVMFAKNECVTSIMIDCYA